MYVFERCEIGNKIEENRATLENHSCISQNSTLKYFWKWDNLVRKFW